MRKRLLIGSASVVLAGTAPANAQIVFAEDGAARGIGAYAAPFGHGGGVIIADYDDDDDADLFVPNGNGVPDQLYRNLGAGTFEEIAADVGLASTAQSRTAIWFDADGDGDLDLLVARDGFAGAGLPATTLILYRQEATGSFTDVTTDAGLFANLITGETHIGGLCAGDIDRDGDLDFFLSLWKGVAQLFENDGSGNFTNVSVASGVTTANQTGWQPIMHDFNRDGWIDIFHAIDFAPNHLWINQHDGTFVDMAPAAGVDRAYNEMGVSLGDYDNDGDLDLYTTNISRKKSTTGDYSILYRNDSTIGTSSFTDVAEASAVQHVGWGWGVTFLDADRDGWSDLAVTNGFNNPEWVDDPSMFFFNPGTAPFVFTDASGSVGFNDTEWGSSLVAVDLDRDGDLDLVQTCNLGAGLRVLISSDTGTTGGHLTIKPRSSGPNGRAIGAVVRATANEMTMTRVITAGTSFLGQEPAEAFFGLGDATLADVRVEWPDGRVTVLESIPAGSVQTVTDDGAVTTCAGDIDLSGDVGFGDLLALLALWGPCPGWCPADLDGDGTIGFSDLLNILGNWGFCS